MSERLSKDEVFIRKLTDLIQVNLGDENFGASELAHGLEMSHSGLNKRLHRITGKTANQFIREFRLNKALEMLQNETLTASEVAYSVGFSSPSYFSTCFHEFFGYPPGHTKNEMPSGTDEELLATTTKKKKPEKPLRKHGNNALIGILLLAVLITVLFVLLSPKIFHKDSLDNLRSPDGRISIAVMPFQNMTNDTLWNIWQKGIQDIFISSLSNFTDELKIRQIGTVNSLIQKEAFTNYALITPSVAGNISRKLNAKVFIYGSIKSAGTSLRLNAQVINSKSLETIKSFEIDGPAREGMIFDIVDSLKVLITDFLVISQLKKEALFADQKYAYTNSSEAYRCFLYAEQVFGIPDFPAAVPLFLKAVSLDTNFVQAAIQLSYAFKNQGLIEEGKEWCLRFYRKRDMFPVYEKTWIAWMYANYFETPVEEIRYLRQIQEFDDQTSDTYYLIGLRYSELQQYGKAIPEFEKSLELRKKHDEVPVWVTTYACLGLAYYNTGQHRKERRLYRVTEKKFPDDPLLIYRQAVLAVVARDTRKAEEYIERYTTLMKENFASEADISTDLAQIYAEAKAPEKAEYFYRNALSLDPANDLKQHDLSRFLIDYELNIYEGLELIDKALEVKPDNYSYLDCKGWGYYKLGRNTEAMALLEKSWELKPEYNHNIYLHLKEVKKAVIKNQRSGLQN